MITQFLQRQMDYIFFCYGFSFILLAFVCHSLRKEPRQRLPWVWLGLFGITHGVNEWLDMLALELGDGRVFAAARLGLMILSYVFLLEFGRGGWRALRGKGPGRWIHLPLLAGVAAGALAGLSGLNPAARYAYGLTGGLWASLALFQASVDDRESRPVFSAAAVLMACHALTAGLIVPKSTFFPASVVNQDSFLSLTGVPIQLVRGTLALLITYALWMHYEHSKRQGLPESVRIEKDFFTNRAIFTGMLAFILILGLIFAEIVRMDADREVRADLLNIIRIATVSLDPVKVMPLTGAASDAGLPEYHLLRGQLLAMGKSNPKFRRLHLMRLLGGKVLFTVDSVPVGAYGHGQPGEKAKYEQPPAELLAAFTGGGAVAVGPYTDEWGTFLSGFSPIREASTGRVVGVLCMDLDADDWHRSIAKYRLASIFITLLVALMALGFFTARLQTWENAMRLAGSEKSLAEAQKIAHLGHWTLNTKTNQVTWSAEMFSIYGLDPAGEAPPYAVYRKLIHPEDRDRVDGTAQKVLAEAGVAELEYRLLRPDGAIRHVLSKVETRRGTGGGMLLLGAMQDITERKQAEQELNNLKMRIEFILGVTKTGLDIIDSQFNMIYLDPEWQKIYGDYQGKKCYEYFADRKTMCPTCGIPEALRTGKPVVSEEILPKEGNRPVQVTTIPFQNEAGEWLVAEVNVDITERERVKQALQESENRFRQVAETAGEWIWEVDAGGLYSYSSSAVEKILGYSPNELVGRKHFYELFPPDEREELKAAALAAFERRETFQGFINPNLHKNGTVVILETSGKPILDEQGHLLGYRGTDTDITARQQGEEALRKSEEYYRRLLEVSPDGVTITDLQGNLIYVSAKARIIYGIPAAIILRGTPALNWIVPEEREKARERIRRTAMGELESTPMTYRLLRQDGSRFWGEISSSIIHDASGKPTGLMSLIRDITGRKLMEEALREQEEFYRGMLDISPDAIAVTDLKGNLTYVSPKALHMFGAPAGTDYLGKSTLNWIVPEDREQAGERIRKLIMGELESAPMAHRMLRHDGTWFWGEISSAPLRDAEGRPAGLMSLIRDITGRMRVEEEVRSARAFLDNIINAVADPIFVKDAARRFVLVNDALCAVVGRPREGLLGQDGDELFPPDQVDVFRRVDAGVLEAGVENVNEELLSNLSTGEVRTIVTRKSLLVDPGGKRFIVGVIRDITDRKRVEDEREKLIGELREAISKVRLLSGFLPICANCKKIRDDKGYWNQIESYISDHSEAEFSHGICPECVKKLYPDHSRK